MSYKASGLRAWVVQRITAIYVGLMFVYLLGKFMFAAPTTAAEFQGWATGPVVSVALLLLVAAILVHAWVGVRDILIDYVWATSLRVTLLSLLALFLIACGFWAAQVLIVAQIA